MKKELKLVWIPGPAIIGAGPSGLAAAACLKQKGIPCLILEKDSCIGSLWKLKTYDRLRLHLPKKCCELPYMPFPPQFPEYPTKEQFICYLETYANNFSVNLMFKQEIQCASYNKALGFWKLRTDEFEFMCRWLIVATGENAIPVIPDIAGMSDFEGKLLHTSSYKSGKEFTGKRVLVVGCGNSGMETGLDLCKNGAEVSIVVRDKVHVLPRDIFGMSTFALSMWLLRWFPVKFVDQVLLFCSLLILGDTQRIGIQRPDIGPLELKKVLGKTPVLDVGTIAKIKSGEIKVLPAIRKLTPTGAEFFDGQMKQFDSVILATGYRSNVASWLKEGNFCRNDGHPENPFPNHWKGNNGLYSIGFSKQGLLGTSMDAQKVAEDIARQWNSEMKFMLDH